MSFESVKNAVKLTSKPVIIKKNKMTLLNGVDILQNVTIPRLEHTYTHTVIYDGRGDFFTGFPHTIKMIINFKNNKTKANVTVAKYFSQSREFVTVTSENVSKLIGQENYNKVYSSLSSISDQKAKVCAFFALLTVPVKTKSVSCQTDSDVHKICVDTYSQTHVTYIQDPKKRRRARRVTKPYVIKTNNDKDQLTNCNEIKKVVIDPKDFKLIIEGSQKQSINPTVEEPSSVSTPNSPSRIIPELHNPFSENSNDSIGNLSAFSSFTHPLLRTNPFQLLEEIDKHTEELEITNTSSNQYTITMFDGSQLTIPVKPEDEYHLATPDILKFVSPIDRWKVLKTQGYIDLNQSLVKNDDGNLPLHIAVLNKDVDFLKRQCTVLKMRKLSVDIPANGNLTALQMAIINDAPECTKVLLNFDADILDVTDDDHRHSLHLAAESSTEHLKAIVEHCKKNARQILRESENLWKPSMEERSDEELSLCLLTHMCSTFDEQGYTPLMLASKLGKVANTELLASVAPTTVNLKMPNSGNTALYLAIGDACLDAEDRGNKSKVTDNYRKTISTLIEYDADPVIENHSGSNVHTLLSDFNITSLSMLIANKLTLKMFGNSARETNYDSVMLLKEPNGNVSLKELNDKSEKLITVKTEKPKVVENIKVETQIVNDPVVYTPKVEINNAKESNNKIAILEDKIIHPTQNICNIRKSIVNTVKLDSKAKILNVENVARTVLIKNDTGFILNEIKNECMSDNKISPKKNIETFSIASGIKRKIISRNEMPGSSIADKVKDKRIKVEKKVESPKNKGFLNEFQSFVDNVPNKEIKLPLILKKIKLKEKKSLE